MRPRYLLPPPPPQGWRDPPQHVSEERERVKGSLKRQCRRVLFRRFFFPRRHPRSPPSSHIWQRGRAGEEEPLLSLPLSSFSRRRSGKSSFFSLPPPSFQSVSACGGSKSEEAHRLVFQWHSFSPFLAWEGGATEFLSQASYLGRRRKFWFSLLPTEILVSVNIQCVLARKGRRAPICIFCLCFYSCTLILSAVLFNITLWLIGEVSKGLARGVAFSYGQFSFPTFTTLLHSFMLFRECGVPLCEG